MHWVRWDQVIAPLEYGGLGIGGLQAFNQALTLKWVWRFVKYPDSKWAKIIRALYGEKAGLDGNILRGSSVWCSIVKLFYKVKSGGVIPNNILRVKIGNGRNTRFWVDNWKRDGTLKDKYKRIYHLKRNKNCTIADRFVNIEWKWEWVREHISTRNSSMLSSLMTDLYGIACNDDNDAWEWSICDDGYYKVNQTRSFIDNSYLHDAKINTRWCKLIPRKVNIFAWRVMLNRLPTHLNLSTMGMVLDHLSCVLCGCHSESISHVLFECPIAQEL
ncbi:uncharacterized protein [Rutidosis leptorrhynchoides]|uniref:uncharacterized protein n=1 Tax=Rutidosis leptorrhynchoides TaxID=125765 RepID=UPI003A9A4A74